jgi:hypothetical protein
VGTDDRMPRSDEVDPDFDGHHERPFAALTADERLDWLWACMELLNTIARRPSHTTGVPPEPPG